MNSPLRMSPLPPPVLFFTEPREKPLPRSLKNTKNQEFLARPTEIKLGDSGEVWKGVIMTNPKNRNENDVGFSWNSRTQKSKQRIFGR
jgi:hypothetical protein